MATSTYLSNPGVLINTVSMTDQCTAATVTNMAEALESTAFGSTSRVFTAGLFNQEITLDLYLSYSAAETYELRAFHEKVLYLLSVDDFSPEELSRTGLDSARPAVPAADTAAIPRAPKSKPKSKPREAAGKKSAKRPAAKKSSRKKVTSKKKTVKKK